MIKLPVDLKLAAALDVLVAKYRFPGRICGLPVDQPKVTEEDLKAIKGDIPHAKDMWCYIIDCPDAKAIEAAASRIWPDKKFKNLSGRFHYPPKGFMGWHTNSNQQGWRLYATFCKEDDKSFFRYQQDGKVITEWEKKGWNFRGFEVSKAKPYWHCVYTDTDRYSFGFNF